MLKVSIDQELVQSEPQSHPQTRITINQNHKFINKIQREHTVNRMSSSFQKGGHSSTLTQLKSSRHTEGENSTAIDTTTNNTDKQIRRTALELSLVTYLGKFLVHTHIY